MCDKKESVMETEEVAPMLFMRRLETIKTRGVVKPSPIAPMKPKVIRNLSTASACMKIDAFHHLFFFFILLFLLLLLLLLLFLISFESPFSDFFPIFFFFFFFFPESHDGGRLNLTAAEEVGEMAGECT